MKSNKFKFKKEEVRDFPDDSDSKKKKKRSQIIAGNEIVFLTKCRFVSLFI